MPWKPGESGNPLGRRRGAKDHLSKAVMEELIQDWAKHGPSVIERVREQSPAQYLQFIARVLPQNMELHVDDARRSIVEYTPAELLEVAKQEATG